MNYLSKIICKISTVNPANLCTSYLPSLHCSHWISRVLLMHVASVNLQSVQELCFMVSLKRGTKFPSWIFTVSEPWWWKDLPNGIRTTQSLFTFKKLLNSFMSTPLKTMTALTSLSTVLFFPYSFQFLQCFPNLAHTFILFPATVKLCIT